MKLNINQGRQKRIAAIHDISGFGKCSLTVALPVISAAGIETCVVPTAVLSTHTGDFEGYTFRDLTEDMLPIVQHWKRSGVELDAVYTGYLGSFEQIDIVQQMIDTLKHEDLFVAVDPVMADHGKLYATFSEDFPYRMRDLCAEADLIMPNITEACLMLQRPYKEGPYTKEYIEELLYGLGQLGAKQVVLTGVCFCDDHLGAASYDTVTGKIEYAFTEQIGGMYHGTGDVFGSALVAAIVKGNTLSRATEIAVQYTYRCVKRTYDAGNTRYYGVNFEAELPYLIHCLQSD